MHPCRYSPRRKVQSDIVIEYPSRCLFINSTLTRFNPVAPTILRPVLRRLNERLLPSKRLSAAQIDVIIANANGDIRNAINTLQFSRLLATPEHLASSRDEPVDLFHMLGKLLYSKRNP